MNCQQRYLVVLGGSPQDDNDGENNQVQNVQPAVQEEPLDAPVPCRPVFLVHIHEVESVEDKEDAKDRKRKDQQAPETCVHLDLLSLTAQVEGGDSGGQRLKGPDVEAGHGQRQGDDHHEHNHGAHVVDRGHGSRRVDDSKEEVGQTQNNDLLHGVSKCRPNCPDISNRGC